jgi:CheY-like chemotaxis protein
MDGYTATKQIKADPALRSIPIIAVTSYETASQARIASCAPIYERKRASAQRFDEAPKLGLQARLSELNLARPS